MFRTSGELCWDFTCVAYDTIEVDYGRVRVSWIRLTVSVRVANGNSPGFGL